MSLEKRNRRRNTEKTKTNKEGEHDVINNINKYVGKHIILYIK